MDSSGDTLSFQTDGRTRRAEIVSAVIELGIGLPVMMLLGTAVGFALFVLGLPIWLCCSLGLLVAFLLIRFTLREAISRLRFRVVFHPDHLELGGGLTRLNIPYEEVELFGYSTDARANCFGILWRGRKSLIYLPADSLVLCLQILQARCVNAVYVDPGGREHLPHNPNRPDFAIGTLLRHFRRTAHSGLAACVALSVLAVYFTAGVVTCMCGKAPFEHATLFASGAVTSFVAAIASFAIYIKYSKKAKSASLKLAAWNLEVDPTR